MAEATAALTLQFLDWVADGRRSYADVMETWRSSCPRLSIWEDALLAGLVHYDPASRTVELTDQGLAALGREKRRAAE
ncbi:MAG: hypothetical protein JNL04_08315 [Rhodospirillaceae bacterium]|nr:hypothetical protein [Rhodospirillaceae bacterium]